LAIFSMRLASLHLPYSAVKVQTGLNG